MHCLSAFVAKLRLVCHIRPHDFAFFLKRNIEKKTKFPKRWTLCRLGGFVPLNPIVNALMSSFKR